MLRQAYIFAFIMLLPVLALGRNKKPIPESIRQFELGRRTFYDFGPPFDFYEIYLVRAEGEGSSIERLTLTPPGASCMQPATVEAAAVSAKESVDELLGGANPCAIPEKDLRREIRRCKKCAVFSGAVTTMQVRCGNQDRVIHSFVLDKDIFDTAPNTPKHTSWTMGVLARLDKELGSNVMDKPLFPVPAKEPSNIPSLGMVQDVGLGRYDALFLGAPHRPSALYRAAQRAVPKPDVNVRTSPEIKPEVWLAPVYPPLARMAHIDGRVVVKFRISADGTPSALTFESGHPMLRPASEKALSQWKFPPQVANQEIETTIDFVSNCSAQPDN